MKGQKMKKRFRIIHYAGMALILGTLVIGDLVAARYNGQITTRLCGFGIDYQSKEFTEARSEGEKLAQEIAGEGITLLKNQNETLPLSNPNLNVFGYAASDIGFHYMGFGSGTNSEFGQVTMYQALEEAGFSLNANLCSAYNDCGFKRNIVIGAMQDYSLYEPDVISNESLMNEAKEFSDTALVVFGRFGTEGLDQPKWQPDRNSRDNGSGRTYGQLTPDEESLLTYAEENFDNVIVAFNSANTMEMGFLDDERVDAALDLYYPGNSGSLSFGKILTGEITPSGHLPDTVAYDMTTAPSFVNSSTNGTGQYNGSDAKYIDYAENIYTGYYWYETADKEGFWNSDFAKNKWGIKYGYQDVIQYPFGYGLSYASFDWELVNVSIPSGSSLNDPNATLDFEVKVRNRSDSAFEGKDVVQLYFEAPYTKGGIEKSAIKLGDFAKSSTLKPGEEETIALSLPLRDMASYDCYDKDNDGFIGYTLEKGDYTLSLRSDVHTLKEMDNNSFTYHLSSTLHYENDEVTGKKIENQFTTYRNETSRASSTYTEPSLSADNYAYSIDGADSGQNITYLTRENFASTFPEGPTSPSVPAEFISKTYMPNNPKDMGYEMPKTSSSETDYTLNDMMGLDYDDPKWQKLVEQLSADEIANLCGDGGLHTRAISSIGKPKTMDSDGPAGFNTQIFGSDAGYATSYPCETLLAASWNWKLAYLMGCSVGKEAEAAGIDGWYGPACNIHRTPLGGRNYEYYSEDPYLSGSLVSYVVQGARENGLYSFTKHFVANETENTRAGGYTWLTEQALRENYLRPFEMAVKDGGTIGIMSSYNRIGSTRTSGSYRLITTVLREEWGFEGCVISDYNNNIPVLCPDEAIRAGNDLMMEVSGGASMFDDRSSATALTCFQNGAKNILYMYTKAQYDMKTSQGLDINSTISTSKLNNIFPWWIPALVGIEIVIGAGVGVWFFFVFRSRKKEKRDNEE